MILNDAIREYVGYTTYDIQPSPKATSVALDSMRKLREIKKALAVGYDSFDEAMALINNIVEVVENEDG